MRRLRNTLRRGSRAAPRSGSGAATELGSAFVESIVAAAIVAMALGTTWRVVADGAARDRAAELRRTALLVAQSELADVGEDIPLAPGAASGQAGALAWRVDITPYEENEGQNPVGALLDIAVSVSPAAGGPSLVTLRSLRLAAGT